MTRLPPPYPHQVVSDWITANDIHVLTDSIKRSLPDTTSGDHSNPLDYDVCMRRARKIQAETIAAISRTISKRIGRVVSNTFSSLRNHRRTQLQIERLSYLAPKLLDDMGIPHDIQVRVRALQSQRQPLRFNRYF